MYNCSIIRYSYTNFGTSSSILKVHIKDSNQLTGIIMKWATGWPGSLDWLTWSTLIVVVNCKL